MSPWLSEFTVSPEGERMVADELFLTWPEVNKRAGERAVALYGRSEDWVHKAIAKLPPVVGILDRNVRYHGQDFLGIPILKPESIESLKGAFVVITASEFHSIAELLEDQGLVPGRDFCCSPDFRSYNRLEQLQNLTGQLLFSSSDYLDQSRARGSSVGGGLYQLDLCTEEVSLLIAGSIRQFEEMKDGRWAAVDFVANKILVLNSAFDVESDADIPSANGCGIAVSSEGDVLLVADAGKDCIYVYDTEDLALLRTFYPFGATSGRSARKHHINDLVIQDDDVFFSYFSLSGGFQFGVFDGGVGRIGFRNADESPQQVLTDLYKPHSPTFIDGELYVANSMVGSINRGREEVAQFPGFVRGLDGVGGLIAAGQSQDMYLLDRDPLLGTTVINTGIYLMHLGIDGVREARFIPAPGLTNIHDVLIIKENT